MLHEWAIYLDLDGVLAAYDEVIQSLGFAIDPAHKNRLNRSGTGNPMKRRMHDTIKGTDFYYRLGFCPGALDLYRLCVPADPIILTAAPKFGSTEDDYFLNPHWLGAAYHKRRWVEEVLLPAASLAPDAPAGGAPIRIPIPDERFICTTSARKQEFIGRKHSNRQVLIDDRRDNCVRWARAGGVAILHDNLPQTREFINLLQFGEPADVRAWFTPIDPTASLADDRCGMIAGTSDLRTWAEIEA